MRMHVRRASDHNGIPNVRRSIAPEEMPVAQKLEDDIPDGDASAQAHGLPQDALNEPAEMVLNAQDHHSQESEQIGPEECGRVEPLANRRALPATKRPSSSNVAREVAANPVVISKRQSPYTVTVDTLSFLPSK